MGGDMVKADMSQLQLDYFTYEELADRIRALTQGPSGRQVLGMATYGSSAPDGASGSAGHAWPHVALPALGEQASGWAEVWSVPADAPAVQIGHRAGVGFSRSADLAFVWLSTPLSTQDHELQAATRQAYDAVFDALRGLGHPHPLRFWNYLPDILGAMQGEERYRIFNTGRHAAFNTHGSLVQGQPPAACALGQPEGLSGPLVVFALASTRAAQPVENPRQVSAYRYPPQYGAQRPLFSRATVAGVGNESTVLISGTASILGYETVHIGDVQAQTEESLNNIEALLGEVGRCHPCAGLRMADLQLKAYVRHPADWATVREVVQRRLGSHPACIYLQAVVCRPDLLVEIEAAAARST